jgi:hydrogenase/urease accessory protein HupE
MKIPGSITLLIATAMMLYAPPGYSHSSGEHAGGIAQQLLHMLQSADHLFIVLALVVVAGMLVYQFARNRD